MRRRNFLSTSLIGGLAVAHGALRSARAESDNPTNEEIKRDAAEWRTRTIAAFPYERIEVPGAEAYAAWQELKAAGRGSPVVLGDDEDVAFMMERFALRGANDETYLTASELRTQVEQRLSQAGKLHHPRDLLLWRAAEEAKSNAAFRKLIGESTPPEVLEMLIGKPIGNPAALTEDKLLDALARSQRQGEWPAKEPAPTSDEEGLTVARSDSRTSLAKAHIAIIPTADWTEIPAYLNWRGRWPCPTYEYHVAALRSWRDRYGAELVGLDLQEMNLRIAWPPSSREEAFALAREQSCYSEDIVRGAGSLAELAAILLVDRWWLFLWN